MDLPPTPSEAVDASGGIGTVQLLRPDFPALVCTLLDLNDVSCICGVSDFISLQIWAPALVPGWDVHAQFELSGELPGFEVDGTVHSIAENRGGWEIVLSFPPLDPALCAQLFEASDGIPDAIPAGESAADLEPPKNFLTPAPRYDESIIFERPKNLFTPPPRPPLPAGPTLDATVEMERPRNLFAPTARKIETPVAPVQPKTPVPPVVPILDATVEMERPRSLFAPTARKIETPVAPVQPKTPVPPVVPILDATVEMERPRSLFAPTARKIETPVAPVQPKTPAPQVIPILDATVEMERLQDHSAQPKPDLDETVGMDTPPPPKPTSIDATVEGERPRNINSPPPRLDATAEAERPRKIGTPPPSLDATIDMARPANLDAPPVSDSNIEDSPTPFGPTVKTDRRASGTGSGEIRPTPHPSGALFPLPAYSKRLGEVLIQMGKLTAEQMDEALRTAQETGERLGHCLLSFGLVQPEVLCRALSMQSGLPMTVLEEDAMPERLTKLFPLAMMMHHNFVPFDESNAVICVAASNPLDAELLKEQEKVLRKVVEVFLAREDQVARQLDWLRLKLKTRSRRTIRFSMRLPVSYQFCNRLGARMDKDVHEGSTVNISDGGYLLDGPQALADPSEMLKRGLYINACVKTDAGEIWAICDVREIRLSDDGTNRRWLLGVEILEMSAECRALMKPLFRRKL